MFVADNGSLLFRVRFREWFREWFAPEGASLGAAIVTNALGAGRHERSCFFSSTVGAAVAFAGTSYYGPE